MDMLPDNNASLQNTGIMENHGMMTKYSRVSSHQRQRKDPQEVRVSARLHLINNMNL